MRWEYKTIDWPEPHTASTLLAIVDKQGAIGWELVSAEWVQVDKVNRILVFKRST